MTASFTAAVSEFAAKARRINEYLKEWGACGFRSGFMHHNLEWAHDLDIKYDGSTFDTDPFEPQPDGVNTIFPFWVSSPDRPGYVELPYTLPQDFTTFIILKEQGPEIWQKKLEWIAKKAAWCLVNVHPDYMNFGGKKARAWEFPAGVVREFSQTCFRALCRRVLACRCRGRWPICRPRSSALGRTLLRSGSA